jgi:hypothetical protein
MKGETCRKLIPTLGGLASQSDPQRRDQAVLLLPPAGFESATPVLGNSVSSSV